MADDVEGLAEALQLGIGLLVRRLRQTRTDEDGLTMPESSALSRLDREGPATAADLARRDRITPQSMGTTLAALAARGLVEGRPDERDGRRTVLSVTPAGRAILRSRRTARGEQIAKGLRSGAFTPAEMAHLRAAAPLLERLAQAL